MANLESNIALCNYAGIPVVELAGEINKKTLAALNDTLGKLMLAGHYNVMINLKRAARQNLNALASLRKVAKLFKTHYGSLDVIAEMDQISGLLKSKPLERLFRFCTSEGQALTQIRRLPRLSAVGITPMPAHLIESL